MTEAGAPHVTILVNLASMLAAGPRQPPLCPAECGRPMLAGALLCEVDWARLSAHRQAAVLLAWRDYATDPCPATVDAYLDARADALAALGVPA